MIYIVYDSLQSNLFIATISTFCILSLVSVRNLIIYPDTTANWRSFSGKLETNFWRTRTLRVIHYVLSVNFRSTLGA